MGLNLHPLSCGNNWGFGSRLPVGEDSHVLDLSGLRRIRQLNLDQDFVEVEPGVTQGDLDDLLQSTGGTHYFNVTGAGRSTSLLGNALERGIGYFGSRKNDLLDLEIALGNGEVVWSKDLSNPHHPGLGPDLTGLFLQSGWGVVIGARVRLRKRPPYMGALLLQMKSTAKLEWYFDEIVTFCREGLFSAVPHIANRQRMLTTFGPYLPQAHLKELERSAPEWSCLVPVSGTKGMIEALFDCVRGRMDAVASCRLIDDDSCQAEPHLQPAVQLALGRPNDFALPGVSFAALSKVPSPLGDLDKGQAGLIHVTPTCTSESKSLLGLLEIIEETQLRHILDALPLTLNLVNIGTVAVIISIPFDRSSRARECAAKEFADSLHSSCCREGYPPYRLGLHGADVLSSMPESRSQLLRQLEEIMDPEECLSPSRYSSWWRKRSAPATKKTDLLAGGLPK